MSDLHRTPYTDLIIDLSGADHREALILEVALRWGWNTGTLDHLDRREFSRQVREVVKVFTADPSRRDEFERLAILEHDVPAAPDPEETPTSGDRVRVWFTGNGVVVEAPTEPKMRPYVIRLDGADSKTYHAADQVRIEVTDEERPIRPMPGGVR